MVYFQQALLGVGDERVEEDMLQDGLTPFWETEKVFFLYFLYRQVLRLWDLCRRLLWPCGRGGFSTNCVEVFAQHSVSAHCSGFFLLLRSTALDCALWDLYWGPGNSLCLLVEPHKPPFPSDTLGFSITAARPHLWFCHIRGVRKSNLIFLCWKCLWLSTKIFPRTPSKICDILLKGLLTFGKWWW